MHRHTRHRAVTRHYYDVTPRVQPDAGQLRDLQRRDNAAPLKRAARTITTISAGAGVAGTAVGTALVTSAVMRYKPDLPRRDIHTYSLPSIARLLAIKTQLQLNHEPLSAILFSARTGFEAAAGMVVAGLGAVFYAASNLMEMPKSTVNRIGSALIATGGVALMLVGINTASNEPEHLMHVYSALAFFAATSFGITAAGVAMLKRAKTRAIASIGLASTTIGATVAELIVRHEFVATYEIASTLPLIAAVAMNGTATLVNRLKKAVGGRSKNTDAATAQT